MKLELNFTKLDVVRQKIGAELNNYSFTSKGLTAFESIETELLAGIELTLDKVDGTAGVFTHEGRQIVIYIKDHTHRPDVLQAASEGNKVHFRDCRTIVDMKQKKRYDRYVATNRRDGLFLIDLDPFLGRKDTELPLNPCQNCLSELNYQNFRSQTRTHKKEIITNFDYEEFLEDYSVFFENKPRDTDKTALPAKYIEGWSRLSRQTRAINNWVCQDCKVDCSDPTLRKWLHVHHINGVKSDNSSQNLEVLCLICHAFRPGHSHMKIPQVARNALNLQRSKI